MKILSLFFLAFILGFCAETLAQNPYIRHFTTLNGLPTNTVYQIYQDSQKFLWFTSDAGVVKFDGSTFTTYRKKDGLSSNDIVRIKEDAKGRLWFFSYNASVDYLYKNKVYNGKNEPFLNSLVGKGFILDFFADSNQTIHFYNWQREVFSLDKYNKVTKDVLFKDVREKLPLVDRNVERIKILYLNKSRSAEWVIWSSVGVFKQSVFQKKRIAVADTVLRSRIIFPLRNNTFYIISYSNELIKVTSNFKKEKIAFPGDLLKIKTVLEDSDGYIWIAAYDEGVYCIRDNKVIRHFDINDALGLLQDHEQNIWVSSQTDGVYVINHDLLKQNHYGQNNFENQGVNQLCDFPGMGVWCSNTKSAFLLNNNTFYKLSVPKAIQPVNLMYVFKDRTLMLGSISQQLCIFEKLIPEVESRKIGYSNRKIHKIFTKKIVNDRSGKTAALFDQNSILFTSQLSPALNIPYNQISERINNAFYNADNVFVINAKRNYLYKNNKLQPNSELSRFNGTIISDYLLLDDSTELFNIDGDSLYILKNHRFYNLTATFDTPIDIQIIKLLYEDSTLYIATLRDLFRCYNPTNAIAGKPVHLDPLNISFNNINDFLIHSDTVYIASDDGLTIIAEASVARTVSLPPIPYLQSITINDMPYLLTDQELNLTGKNNIHLSFGCISYTSGSVFYSYKLEGSENSWTVGSGSGINLVYQNLPKGSYVFKLRVRKSNSDWSIPLELAITIKPTLIEHPAFWIVVISIVFIVIIAAISLIRNQKMRKVEVDHQLIVMEQKALQSMMNPHFIFNSLGSIQNYLLKNKGKEAVIYLSQFAQLIRQNLNAVNTPMIALEEEVDRLKNYLDLEKKRLENKFDYSIEIDNSFMDEGAYIPSMIIQPIAENSIWHGIATLEEKGEIRIRLMAYKPKSLKIIIEDNGIGIKKSQEYAATGSHHKQLGRQIIEKRLALLSKKYNAETSIQYSESNSDSDNPGTKVELILPFINSIDEI